MRFKVGDVVVLSGPRGVNWVDAGVEMTILEYDGGNYRTDCPGALGHYWWTGEGLTLKHPPAFERGSWDEIECVTGWSPGVHA